MTEIPHQTESVVVNGHKTQLTTGGQGQPLVYLHITAGLDIILKIADSK